MNYSKSINFVTVGVSLLTAVVIYLIYGLFAPTSVVYLKEIPEGKTGSQVCFEAGMSCISTTTMEVYDTDGEFYGFVTPNCDSQVEKRASCVEDFGTEYSIDNVTYKKAVSSESKQNLAGSDYLCMASGKGKKGIYEYAHCVNDR